jgi:putative ABC transport system permease protein
MYNDFRFAIRQLLKSPALSAVAVLTLSLGIGANTAIFSVVNSVLLRPLPYPKSDSLVLAWDTNPAERVEHSSLSPAKVADVRARAHTLELVAGYYLDDLNLRLPGETKSVSAALTTGPFFPTVGVKPLLGRTFTAADDRSGAPSVAVLSYGFWRGQFASDPNVVGRQIELAQKSCTIVGVMPPNFTFPKEVEIWTPAAFADFFYQSPSARLSRFVTTICRLQAGVSLPQAQADIEAAGEQIARQHPTSDAGWQIQLVSLYAQTVGSARHVLLLLSGAVGLVLLIACVNIASLQLIRAESRRREMAVRLALGAERSRLVRQLLVESLVLAAIGGAVGTLLAFWGVDLLVSVSDARIPRLGEIKVDGVVLLFTLGLATLTGVIAGFAPAVEASRVDLDASLRESGLRAAGSQRGNRLRGLFLVGEIALALLLAISAGLLIESLLKVERVDPGFRRENVLTLKLALPWAQVEKSSAFYDRVLERVSGLPSVEAAGSINFLPFDASSTPMSFIIEGRPQAAEQSSLAEFRIVSGGYFRVLGIPLRSGRTFGGGDTAAAPPVVMVNEKFARQFFPNENPIGQHLRFPGRFKSEQAATIVGVVGAIHHAGLDQAPVAEMYFPYQQAPWPSQAIVARTTLPAETLIPSLQRALFQIDPTKAAFDIQTMADRLDRSVAERRFNTRVLALFALAALALAATGVYGVISYDVSQRTREIGIRMALGADGRSVLKLVLSRGCKLAIIGILIGTGAAVLTQRFLSSLLFGVSANDGLTLLLAGTLVLLIAVVASWLPARRASGINPIEALHTD